MYEVAKTGTDVDLVLSLLGAVYVLARSDCFMRITRADVTFNGAKSVTVRLSHLKGSKRARSVSPTLEAVPSLGVLTNSIFGALPLCPVQVFKRLCARATGSSLCNLKKASF